MKVIGLKVCVDGGVVVILSVFRCKEGVKGDVYDS